MTNWEKLLQEKAFTPEGSGPILHKYDAEGIALLAHIEGMQMYNQFMEEWSASDELDPETITKRVNEHIEKLKKHFNIPLDGGEFSTDSSM